MATYQRGKYWWYRFRFAGERIDEPTKSTSRTVAKEAERQHRRTLEAGYNNFKEVRQNRVRILEEIIDEYLTGYRLRYRSASFAEYALGHVSRLLGSKIVADITDISVLRYQEDRLREKAAPKSINEEVRFLLKMLGDPGEVIRAHLKKTKQLKLTVHKQIGKAFDSEETQNLATNAKSSRSPHMYPAFMLARNGGLRDTEIKTLTWGQINFVAKTVQVGRAKSETGEGRIVPLNSEAYQALADHRAWYLKRFGEIRDGAREIRDEWYVFPWVSPGPRTRHGNRTTVADGLPSSQTSPAQGNLVSGVGDVAFVGDELYAILAGAGCSHGLKGTVNAVLRIHRDGTWSQVADLSAFQMTHPTANISLSASDFEPDGTWYSMIAVNDSLYAVEPNHQEVDRINPRSGEIHRISDVSTFNSSEWIGPTGLTRHDGEFYFGTLGKFPIVDGSSSVYRLRHHDDFDVVESNLTTVLGVAFDDRDRLYVLENTTGAGNLFPTPMTGDIVRFDRDGSRQVIVTGLFLPTAMIMGPDGNLYVSNVGFGPPPVGMGQVLKVELPGEHD